LLIVMLCAAGVAGANIILYRRTAGLAPTVRRAAQLVLPALLLSATIAGASFRTPVLTREPRAVPTRLALTAQSAKGLVDSTRALEADPLVTGSLKPKEPRSISARTPLLDRRDVVQVFYGTDRARADKTGRIGYGSDRAQRLELGQALVTVPAAHQTRSTSRERSNARSSFRVAGRDEVGDSGTHFTVSQIGTLTRLETYELVAARLQSSKDYKGHALLFIHGYNNDFDHALYRTAQIAYDLKFDGAAFLYSWPSGGSFTAYTYDRDSAGQAEPYLREFVNFAVMRSGATHVSLIAHGIGSEPLLRVLADLRQTTPGAPRIHQVILVAPDVDRDSFADLAKQVDGVSNGITLYASSNDLALGISRRLSGGIARAGDVTADGPVTVPGIDTIDISALSIAYFAMNQSTYAEQTALVQDVERLLLTGTRPPDQRLPALKRIAGPSGAYWRYP
jgi:esterase/lipase superfamily enzyme